MTIVTPISVTYGPDSPSLWVVDDRVADPVSTHVPATGTGPQHRRETHRMTGHTPPAPLALRLAGLAAFALIGITCRDRDPMGPGLPTRAAFAVAPQFARAAAADLGFLSLRKVRGTLTPIGGGMPYSAEASFEGDSATLSFDVTFAGPTQRYSLAIAAFDTAGDTLFRSQREVLTRPGDNRPVSDTLAYVAPDTALRFLSLSVSDTVLLGGDSVRVVASGYDDRERPIAPLRLAWTSRDSTLAKVVGRPSSATLLGGATESDVWIVASAFNGTVDSLLVPVRLKVGRIILEADTLRLAAGTSGLLGASVLSPTGVELPGRAVAWTSLDSTIALVTPVPLNPRGAQATGAVATTNLANVTGINPGVARIVASTDGKADTTLVIVTPSPVVAVTVTPDTLALLVAARARLVAETRDARGVVVTNRAVSWTSSDDLLARVDSGGIVTAVAPGLVKITATSEGVTGTASIRIDNVQAQIVRTVVSPARIALHSLGQSAQVTARSYAPDSSLTGGNYSWRVDQQGLGIVSVDSLGRVTALGVGSAWVIASEAGGTSDSASVDVSQVAASIVVDAPKGIDALGLTTAFRAAALDSLGNKVPGTAFTWSVENPAVATLALADADSAVVLSVGNGTTAIIASASGASATTSLSVAQAATAIDVSPAALSLGLDGRAQLNAVAYDRAGARLGLKPGEMQWGVEGSGGEVEVDSTGEVHARTTGTGGVFAALKGARSKTVPVSVDDRNPLTLSFSTDTLTLADSATISVFLSAGRTVPITIVLADSGKLVRFAADTVILEQGTARRNFVVYGTGQGSTTISATDLERLFAPATMSLTVGKIATQAARARRNN